MTRLLRHDGHSVDLFLLDPAVDVEQQPTVDDELAAYWRCEELFNALAFAADEAEKGKVAEEIVAVLADVTDDKVSAAGLDTAWRDRVRVWRQLLETAMDHTFEPMPGRLHLLVGDEVTHGMTYGDYLHRWHELATGGVDAHRVPGNHLGVLRPPHVATLAARLTELMSGSAR
jgi:thioesterase domain-containing protein